MAIWHFSLNRFTLWITIFPRPIYLKCWKIIFFFVVASPRPLFNVFYLDFWYCFVHFFLCSFFVVDFYASFFTFFCAEPSCRKRKKNFFLWFLCGSTFVFALFVQIGVLVFIFFPFPYLCFSHFFDSFFLLEAIVDFTIFDH